MESIVIPKRLRLILERMSDPRYDFGVAVNALPFEHLRLLAAELMRRQRERKSEQAPGAAG